MVGIQTNVCQVNVKRTDVFANGCSCEQMFGRIPITVSEQKNGNPITATERKNGDLPITRRFQKNGEVGQKFP